MNPIRQLGLHSRAAAAQVAATGLAVCVILQLASVWFVDGHRTDLSALVTIDGVGLLSAWIAALVVPWDRLPRQWLLVFPLGGFGAAYALGRDAPHVAIAYIGLLILAFAFVGLTQRHGMAFFLVVPAACAWASMQQTPITGQLRVRLVIAMAIWILVADILAWKMSELSRQQDALAAMAQRDALTGLDNRHALPAAFTSYEPETALIMIDIDYFKRLNDTHGHAEGDRALQDFAHVLSAVLRGADSAFRYGGEEFLIVAPRTGVAGADQLLTRIKIAWNAARVDVTFSAGISTWGANEAYTEGLRRADEALYAAKRAGRDRWLIAEGETSADDAPVVVVEPHVVPA